MARSSNLHRGAVSRPLVIALALGGAACGAWGQEFPTTIGISQEFRHDSNLFRTADGEPRTSDIRSITGVEGSIERQFGLQRLFADALVQLHRFDDTTALNHTSYGLNLGLDWSARERWSGTVRYSLNESLADYSTPGTTLRRRNMERSQLLGTTARFGVSEVMAIEGGLEHRGVDYSAVEFNTSDFHQNVARLGVRYGLTGALRLGAGVRYTRGTTPRFAQPTPGEFVADKLKRRDVDFTAEWTPSPITSLDARVSLTRETHSVAQDSDFSGVTWSLGASYQPTEQLGLTARVSRDTGSELRFTDFTGGDPRDPAEIRGITTAFELGARYRLTSTVEVNARARRSRGDLLDQGTGAQGSDTTTTYALSVEWAATRTITAGCAYARESRSTASDLSFRYRANVVGCAVQARFP